MARLRVGVLFGGRSAEHEISLRSATAVVAHLDPTKYEVVPLAITPEGSWLTAARFDDLVVDFKLHTAAGRLVACLPDPTAPGLLLLGSNPAAHLPVDVIFPVLHGTLGEDGTVQGLLEMANLAYVGCGVLASASGMDKDVMKRLFRDAGLPIGRFITVLRHQWESTPASVLEQASALGWPVFVKPANLGSSVGVSRADDAAALHAAVDLACKYDRKIIIEEGIHGREIELSVLGNDDISVSIPGEIFIGDTFYSFDDKYAASSQAGTQIPAVLPADTIAELQRQAAVAFRAIDGSGLARADFFVRHSDGKVLINELNTLPGFTSISMYPKMWQESGLRFEHLLDKLIDLGLARHADRQRNQTSRL